MPTVTRTSEYEALNNAKRRCRDPKHPSYRFYGARGIKVCDEWRAWGGYRKFLAHIGPKPTPQHTLDRWPNKNGNYEPGNVRWATPKQQALNTRANIYIEAHGERLHINEWMERTGLRYEAIRLRIFRGWPPEQVVDPHHKRTARSYVPQSQRGPKWAARNEIEAAVNAR